MTRTTARLSLSALTMMAAAAARAGDNSAHTAAMVRAAQQVLAQPAYANGVGAPVINGTTQMGIFQIPNDESQSCGFDANASFGDGSCPYSGINGLSINAPDAWSCLDTRAPPKLNGFNSSLSLAQTSFGSLLALKFEEAALACNYTHFTQNPMIPGLASAPQAAQVTADWAEEIPTSIETFGADLFYACDNATWLTYYARIGNQLHYVQDMQSEDHADGNIACSVNDAIPLAQYNAIFAFKDTRTCAGFITDTITKAVGPDPLHAAPVVFCDQSLVDPPDVNGDTLVNANINKAINLCSLNLTLSCMGIERTLRHHCKLPGTTKLLQCNGPASDHSPGTNQSYCEGETYPGAGGPDFIGLAVTHSVPVLQAAAARWATVCKQPDDPCVPAQCDTWCKRSQVPDPQTLIPDSGFCVNTPTDDASQCVLHTCQCILSGTCGALNSPCCTATTPCTDAANECSASNGLCVPKGTGACTPGLKNGDFSAGLQYWNQTTLSGGGDVTINNSVSYNCLATQTGNPFAFENVYEAAVYLSQVFTVPTGATTLEMDAWNNLDPQDAIISVVLNGVETVLATVEPNAMQELSDPSNDYSVVCTGLPVSHLTYPIGAYAGKSVELRLGGAYVSGYNGTYISYDNVVVH